MHYIYLFLLIIICVFSFKHERNVYNPVFLFSGVWAIAMFLSGLCLYDLKETSFYAYSLAFIGVVFFCLGAMIRNRFKFKSRKIAGINTANDYDLNFGFLIAFYTLVVIFTAYLASISISLLMRGGSMDVIRNNYNDVEAGVIVSSNLVFVIENFIVEAAVFASVALIPIVTTYKKSIKKYILLIELVVLQVSFIFVSGARSFLIDVALLFGVYIVMNKSLSSRFKHYFNKIPRFLFVLIAVGGIIIVGYMTILRKGDERPLAYEIYRYISLAFPLFDTRLHSHDPSTFTHGWTLLHGFVKTPFFIFRKLTHIPWPAGLTNASNLISANNDYYFVGGGFGGRGGYVNSFVTAFYYMYMDFGIIGIIVESFMYGYFCQSCYKKVINNPNRRTQAFYLLVAIGLLLSFVRSFFTAHRYVNAFIILFFAFVEAKETLGDNKR